MQAKEISERNCKNINELKFRKGKVNSYKDDLENETIKNGEIIIKKFINKHDTNGTLFDFFNSYELIS